MIGQLIYVSDFMTPCPVTVTPEMSVLQAVEVMLRHDVSGTPVVDAQQRLVGIITERDCIRVTVQAGYFDQSAGRVSEYMSRQLSCVQPKENLMDVAVRFIDEPFRRFPVVDNGKLVGIIGRKDVLRAIQHSFSQ